MLSKLKHLTLLGNYVSINAAGQLACNEPLNPDIEAPHKPQKVKVNRLCLNSAPLLDWPLQECQILCGGLTCPKSPSSPSSSGPNPTGAAADLTFMPVLLLGVCFISGCRLAPSNFSLL